MLLSQVCLKIFIGSHSNFIILYIKKGICKANQARAKFHDNSHNHNHNNNNNSNNFWSLLCAESSAQVTQCQADEFLFGASIWGCYGRRAAGGGGARGRWIRAMRWAASACVSHSSSSSSSQEAFPLHDSCSKMSAAAVNCSFQPVSQPARRPARLCGIIEQWQLLLLLLLVNCQRSRCG